MEIARWGAWVAPLSVLEFVARASSCMVCDEEFAGRVGVIIGLYVKRISEGMGKDSIEGEGYSAGCHADR